MILFFSWLFKRREWLQEALASVTEDTFVKRMMEHLQTLDKPDSDDEDELVKKEDAFEDLQEIVDNIDNANGLYADSVNYPASRVSFNLPR